MSAKRHSRPDRPLEGGATDRTGRRRAVGVLSAFAMAITLGLVGVLPSAQVATASHTLDLVSVVPARLLETRVGPTFFIAG